MLMRVLALVPGGIGDQLLFFPTLEDLKRTYPDAVIDVVVEPRAKAAYRVCQSVNDVVLFDFKDRNSPADWANLLGIMRDRDYDLALSLGQRWGVAFLLWLTGVPVRVGYESPASWLLTNSVPLKPEQYAADMYHDLLQGIGITTPCPPLSIQLLKADLDWADAERRTLGLSSGYFMVHGGSSKLAQEKGIDKLYPVENWKVIIQDIRQRQPDVPLVVVRGPEDDALVNALLTAFPELTVTTPPDIGKLAAMIAGATLMLCTDSGPMHMAIALQVYTLALFGPTDPAKLMPQSDKFKAIQSPTGKMSDIAPAEVLKQVWGG